MARFFVLWCRNTGAAWPTDPAERLKFSEQIFASNGSFPKEYPHYFFFLAFLAFLGVPHLPKVIHLT